MRSKVRGFDGISLQPKMTQGKQMRVGAREFFFAYNSVKLVLMANGIGYDVDSNTFF